MQNIPVFELQPEHAVQLHHIDELLQQLAQCETTLAQYGPVSGSAYDGSGGGE